MRIILLCIGFFLSVYPFISKAQKTVGLGIKLGVGDAKYWGVEGYSQLGINVGVAAPINLGQGFYFQPEVLFSLRGGERLTRVDSFPTGYANNLTDRIDTVASIYNKDRIGYVQIPLLCRIDLIRREEPTVIPYVIVGPMIGFNLLKSAKTITHFDEYKFQEQARPDFRTDRSLSKLEVESDGKIENLTPLSLGLVLGVGFSVPVGTSQITLEARYDLDFNALYKDYKITYVGTQGRETYSIPQFIRTRMLGLQVGYIF